MYRILNLHSLRFVISSETIDLGPSFDALYIDCALGSHAGPTGHRSELTLNIELGDPMARSSVIDRPGAVFAETNLCGGACFFADGCFGARLEGEFAQYLEYDLETAAIHCVLGGRFSHEPNAIPGRVIRPILQSFLLPFHGLKSLHGALVARDGRGTLLAGAGGAGKTTTAISFGQHGWTVLSDDGPLFALRPAGTVGLSSLDYLHVSERTLDLFPALKGYVVGGRDHRDKVAISPAGFADRDQVGRPVVVNRYIELRRSAIDRPRVVPLDRAVVLRRLVAEEMVVFRSPQFRTEVFARYSRWCLDLLASLVSGLEAFAVEFDDRHLHEVPGLVERLASRG